MAAERQVVRVYPSRLARRAAARAVEREARRQRDIALIRSGVADKLLARGVDPFARSAAGSADRGAGRTEQTDMPAAAPTFNEWIRAVVNDPERKKERQRIKRAGNNDVRNAPDDAPAPTSYPAVPWEFTS